MLGLPPAGSGGGDAAQPLFRTRGVRGSPWKRVQGQLRRRLQKTLHSNGGSDRCCRSLALWGPCRVLSPTRGLADLSRRATGRSDGRQRIESVSLGNCSSLWSAP